MLAAGNRRTVPAGRERIILHRRIGAYSGGSVRGRIVFAMLACLLLAPRPARAQEWLETRAGAVRILYRQGNGAEASTLTRGIPPVLADLEKDLDLPLTGEIVV